MEPEIIICFGKMLFTDQKPDWFLESRLNRTIEIANKFPWSQIVLTGGKSHLIEGDVEVSEAQAMFEYVTEQDPELENRIIIEDKGDSTVHQIIKIKTDIVMNHGFKVIAVVTDDIHMPRVKTTTQHIFGDKYKILDYPSEARISGTWRKAIEEVERKGFELTQTTRIAKITPGDHKEWQRLNDEWKAMSKEEKEKILNTKL